MYDTRCDTLARIFLEDSSLNCEAVNPEAYKARVSGLAQHIQDAIEGWLESHDGIEKMSKLGDPS